MEWVLLVFGGGGVALAGRYLWDRRALRRRTAAELEQVRRLARDEVTRFGEELGRLDEALRGRQLDAEAKHDYQAALDAYETAGRIVARIEGPEGVGSVVGVLADGRYALACVRARAAGAPLPEYRPPCFFNAHHGPSVADVEWTPPNGPTRKVPTCAQDLARIQAGEEPEIQYVEFDERRVPYWEVAPNGESYRLGSFSAFGRAHDSGLGGEGGGRWGIDDGRNRF